MYRDIGPLVVLVPEEMEYVTALPAADKRDLIISGFIDYTLRTITLYRGDGTSLIAPLSMFKSNPVQSPDFDKFSIIDHGLALAFGEYEAAVDYVLYELDPQYKLRADANRLTN